MWTSTSLYHNALLWIWHKIYLPWRARTSARNTVKVARNTVKAARNTCVWNIVGHLMTCNSTLGVQHWPTILWGQDLLDKGAWQHGSHTFSMSLLDAWLAYRPVAHGEVMEELSQPPSSTSPPSGFPSKVVLASSPTVARSKHVVLQWSFRFCELFHSSTLLLLMVQAKYANTPSSIKFQNSGMHWIFMKYNIVQQGKTMHGRKSSMSCNAWLSLLQFTSQRVGDAMNLWSFYCNVQVDWLGSNYQEWHKRLKLLQNI